MATKFRGFRALGIVGFAALTVTMVSACNSNAAGNGIPAGNFNGNGSAVPRTVAASGQGNGSGTGSGYSGVTTPPAAAGVPAAPAPAAVPAAAASVSKCLPVNLTFTLGNNRQAGQSQRVQVVDMTNHASTACTMQGFPGVDVIGDTSGQPNNDWTLSDSSANGSAKVTLQPGATAHFDLVYLPGDLASGGGSENVMSVQRMVITTPGQDNQRDDTIQGSLNWFQDVVFQQDATHPGTYIMPVASGS